MQPGQGAVPPTTELCLCFSLIPENCAKSLSNEISPTLGWCLFLLSACGS